MSSVVLIGTTSTASRGGDEDEEAVEDAKDMAVGAGTPVSWLRHIIEHLVGVVARGSRDAMETTREASRGGEEVRDVIPLTAGKVPGREQHSKIESSSEVGR